MRFPSPSIVLPALLPALLSAAAAAASASPPTVPGAVAAAAALPPLDGFGGPPDPPPPPTRAPPPPLPLRRSPLGSRRGGGGGGGGDGRDDRGAVRRVDYGSAAFLVAGGESSPRRTRRRRVRWRRPSGSGRTAHGDGGGGGAFGGGGAPDGSDGADVGTATTTTTTRIGRVATAFESVLEARGCESDGDDDGDIDAAALLSACRTFLSVLRETGPGAVADDFAGNLRKAEGLYELAAAASEGGGGADPGAAGVGGWTLTSLLRLEAESGVHPPAGKDGPILRDPSGAVGLLWMRRSLSFQSDLYGSLAPPPPASASAASSSSARARSPSEAALSAYRSNLCDYHGWALRRFYTAFLSAGMPGRGEMMAALGGYERDAGGGVARVHGAGDGG